MTNEIIEANGNGLALPSDMLAALAEEAKAAAAQERPAIGRISLQSGQMSYAGQPIPGNKLEAIILYAGYRNVWYAGRFNKDKIVNPNCYALSDTDEGMAPDPALVRKPEHPTCDGCPHNEWGSDRNGGRGKDCKQSRRLVLMPASVLSDPDAAAKILSAELATMDMPVTSVKNYSQFVNALAASAKVPQYAAVTEVSTTPDPKSQFKVNFRPLRVVPSAEILNAIRQRLADGKRIALEPYDDTAVEGDEEDDKPNAKPSGKKSKF